MSTTIEVNKTDAEIQKGLAIPKLAPMAKVYAGIGEIVTRLSAISIKTADDYDQAMKEVKAGKQILKELENAEDEIIKNPEGFVKSVKNLRKLISGPVNLGLTDANAKMTKFQNDQYAKRQKEAAELQLKAQKEAEKVLEANTSKEAAKIEIKIAKIEEKAAVILTYKPTTVDRVRKFEVVNPDEVERIYCSPDDKKIKPFVGAVDGAIPVIKGVRIWDTAKPVAR